MAASMAPPAIPIAPAAELIRVLLSCHMQIWKPMPTSPSTESLGIFAELKAISPVGEQCSPSLVSIGAVTIPSFSFRLTMKQVIPLYFLLRSVNAYTRHQSPMGALEIHIV